MRVRSTTRARRLLVPSARTEEALVRMAGATTAVKTAKGLPATTLYCTARPFFSVVDVASLACGGLAFEQDFVPEKIRPSPGIQASLKSEPQGGKRGQARSRMTAMPWPTPMHMVQRA